MATIDKIHKRTSLVDLARLLNLSTATVSRALRDHNDLSVSTRARVKQAAKDHNYTPNSLAVALRTGHGNTLGVIVPYINGFFFPAVINGIEKMASQAGFNVMICQSNEDVQRERAHIEMLLAAQVQAIFISISASTGTQIHHLERVQQQGVPLIFFDRIPEMPGSNAVLLDDRRGACRAVTHLIEQGCRRIAHFAGPQYLNTNRNRYLGYLDALQTHGLQPDKRLVYELPTFSQENGRLGMAHLLELTNRPDALFTVCGVPAAGALDLLIRRGIRVPQDIALACFSNEPFTTMTQPRLTAVDQQAEQMGVTAVTLLLQLLKRGTGFLPSHIILKSKLQVRESSLHQLSGVAVGPPDLINSVAPYMPSTAL